MPFLSHLTDDYLLAQPIDALFRLNREEKQADTARAAKGLDMKLYQNFKEAAENPIYMDGYDNRSSYLHPARFLPGAGVPVQRLWLEARKLWGQEGKKAIANYDLEALGCSGCVTARGWDILHKPGSPELSLKLFTVANVGHSATGAKTVSLSGEDSFTIHDSWKDIEDMGELKRALNNLLVAAQMALPWNFAFQVLHGFLKSNDFMSADLSGHKMAPVLAGFIDHVFKVNAGLWVQEQPFLDAAKLLALWKSWWCSRKTGLKAESNSAQQNNNKNQKNNQNNNNQNKGKGQNNQAKGGNGWQGQQGGQGGGQQLPNFSGPPAEYNICKRFNEKTCTNHFSGCSISTKVGVLRLYHLCNSMVQKDGNTKKEYCLQKHPRLDHK